MTSPIDRIAQGDQADILALNNEHAAELSWLEAERLSFLLGEAFYARRIGDLEAFIMTFDQDARYDSPNFVWFRERYLPGHRPPVVARGGGSVAPGYHRLLR